MKEKSGFWREECAWGKDRLEHKGPRARRLEWEHHDLVSQVKGLGSTTQARGRRQLKGPGRAVT